jgi:glycosyltransferase involved in cell wall biosynthesis
MSIAAVTPTRDRALTIKLLARWVRQQTLPVDRWIVVDDGDVPVSPEPEMTHLVRRARTSHEPEHSLCLNLRQALPFLTEDKVLILEDDEYYAPTYVEEMSRRLDASPAVGIGFSKYYHLGFRSPYVHENMAHASLAQTSFRSELLDRFIRAMADPREKFVDIKFWKQVRAIGNVWRDGNRYDDRPGAQYVGLKGMPGREGIGFGHKAMPQYRQDPALEWLRGWIRPEDFVVYEQIAEELWAKKSR